MLDITAIILTYNEEVHIGRCIENIKPIAKEIIVVDCFSSDATKLICEEKGAKVLEHKWPGNQAEQFNWALENVQINTQWILRIDADEYLSAELINEIQQRLPLLEDEISGCILKRDVIFMGKRIKHGKIKTVKLLRLWRTGRGVIENRLMDEHTILTEGETVEFNNYFFDDNLNGIDSWIKKHLDYSNREVVTYVRGEATVTKETENRNKTKSKYYSLPLFHRGFWFFVLRYILLGGFLDGKAGFVWNFMQCWWYRTLVDSKLYYIKMACGDDKDKVREHLKTTYGLDV